MRRDRDSRQSRRRRLTPSCLGLLAVWASLFVLLASRAGAQTEEPFSPKGSYTNSIHRFFPDLDARMNAVRYGRWRAIEIAWRSGINGEFDKEFSSYLLALMADPPRFAPEADRVAPRFAREAPPVFRTLRWGQVFERQVLDILAAPDATPQLDEDRIERVFNLYRRERWVPSEPSTEITPTQALPGAPVSASILVAGTRLFALAAENLLASEFGQQRWRVKETVAEFDGSFTLERPLDQTQYRVVAPTVFSRFPTTSAALDRLERFRADLFETLAVGGPTSQARRQRDEKTRELARRWAIPVEGIGGR